MKFLEKLAQLFKEEVPAPAIEQKPVELKKRTKKLVEKRETIDLGVTTVKLTFQDGRELITRVYGFYRQKTNSGCDEVKESVRTWMNTPVVEPTAEDPVVVNSVLEAENFICKVGRGKRENDVFIPPDNTFVDCPRKPTVSFVGKVISAQIIKTEQCLEEVTKYYVEPI